MDDSPSEDIIRRELDTERGEPAIQIAEIIAEIEGKDVTEISTMYDCVDGVVDHLFEQPPSPDAEMTIEFEYENYRVAIEQTGDLKLVRTE